MDCHLSSELLNIILFSCVIQEKRNYCRYFQQKGIYKIFGRVGGTKLSEGPSLAPTYH